MHHGSLSNIPHPTHNTHARAPAPPPLGFAMHWHELFGHVLGKVHNMTWAQLAFVVFLIVMMMAGNALQIIGVNFWLRSFSDGSAGSFTVFAISGLSFAIFFSILLALYWYFKRPDLTFLRSRRGWYLLFAIGLMDAVNSFFAIYAANYTPEMLQALFMALTPIYTCVLSKYILGDTRQYSNPWVLASFFLMIAGVATASAPDMADAHSEDRSQAAWTMIFFVSVPLASLYNVWQAQYMEEMTVRPTSREDEDMDEGTYSEDGGDVELTSQHDDDDDGVAPPLPSVGNRDDGNSSSSYGGFHNSEAEAEEGRRRREHEAAEDLLTPDGIKRGEDTIVKLVMLFGDTGLQFVMTVCMLPLDAIPWFGQSSSVANAGESFGEGVSCIFTCNMNGVFCLLYSSGFVFTYIGSAYLNHYSATLCSMIGQLSSPVTALLLILVPQWNVVPGVSGWYWSVIAIVLLSVGTVIYFAWEEMTAPTEDGSMVTLLGSDGLPRQRLPTSQAEAEAYAAASNNSGPSSTVRSFHHTVHSATRVGCGFEDG